MENFDERSYRRAKKKVNEIKGFYYHLACYIVVIPVIIFINLTFTPEFLWFFFSMIGWGLGLAFHGMEVFGYHPFLGKGWEERKLKELMDKEKEKRNKFE